MALCPKCHKNFRVPEGDTPEEHGCPYCGYGDRWFDEEEEE